MISADLGPYKEIVANGAWAIAAAGALLSTWFGKQKWHPTSEVVERFGILIPAVAIVMMFAFRTYWPIVAVVGLTGLGVAIQAVTKYTRCLSEWRYYTIRAGRFNRAINDYFIGGGETDLTDDAKRQRKPGMSIQDLLNDFGEPDRVFDSKARARNEATVATWYLRLVSGGTIALAGAGIIAAMPLGS